jgi:hypothetical protein
MFLIKGEGSRERLRKEGSVRAGNAAMLEADEDAVPQAVGGAAAEGSLTYDPEQLPGVIELLAAVSARPDVIPERRQQLLFHLVVEE